MFRKSRMEFKNDSSLDANLLESETTRNLIPETIENKPSFNLEKALKFVRDPEKSISENLKEYQVSYIDKIFGESADNSDKNFEDKAYIQMLPISDDAINGMKKIPLNTIGILKDYELNNYLDDLLAPQTKFCRRISRDNIMKWQGYEISAPLTKILNEEFNDTATSMFNHLLMYSGDKKPINDKYYHARKFIRLPLNQTSGDDLKEEAYIQCLKQIRENPDPEKLDMVWSLFCILASSYLPNSQSQRLYYSILNHLFIFSKMNDSNPLISKRCDQVYSRLYNSSIMIREEIPSRKEMIFIENMRPISIPIYFFSGEYILVNFESYTSIKQVKEELMEKLGFNPKRFSYYGMFEICSYENKCEERFLDESKLLVDILSIWEQTQNLEDFQNIKLDFKIYIKMKYFYQIGDDDIDSVAMLYNQNVYKFLQGRFDFDEKHIISLSSLKLLNEFSSDKEEAFKVLNNKLENYIPWDLIHTNPPAYWTEKIMNFYAQFPDYSGFEIQKNFNEIAGKDPISKAHLMKVTIPDEKINQSPQEIIELIREDEYIYLALRSDELLIYSTGKPRKDVITIKYSELENWAINDFFFYINQSKKNLGDLTKFYFKTYQGLEIQEILDTYIMRKVGKDEKEIQKVKSEYPEKFKKIYSKFSKRAFTTFEMKNE